MSVFKMKVMLYEGVSRNIIKDFYDVYSKLGYGFVESIYEESLKIELKKSGFVVESQWPIEVFYDGFKVGTFKADLIVNDLIILELKVADNIHAAHEAQLINYLKATDIEVGYVLNFGKTPEFKRKVFSNSRK